MIPAKAIAAEVRRRANRERTGVRIGLRQLADVPALGLAVDEERDRLRRAVEHGSDVVPLAERHVGVVRGHDVSAAGPRIQVEAQALVEQQDPPVRVVRVVMRDDVHLARPRSLCPGGSRPRRSGRRASRNWCRVRPGRRPYRRSSVHRSGKEEASVASTDASGSLVVSVPKVLHPTLHDPRSRRGISSDRTPRIIANETLETNIRGVTRGRASR